MEIGNAIVAIGGPWALLLAAITLGLIWLSTRYYREVLESGGTELNALVKRAEQNGDPGYVYRAIVRGLLQKVDTFLRDNDGRPISSKSSYTPELFDLAAFVTIVYPFAALLLNWTLEGDAGRAGVAIGLVPHASYLSRFSLSIALIIFLVSAVAARALLLQGRRLISAALLIAAFGATMFLIWPIFLTGFASTVRMQGETAEVWIFCFLVALMVIYALIGNFTHTTLGKGTGALTTAFALALAAFTTQFSNARNLAQVMLVLAMCVAGLALVGFAFRAFRGTKWFSSIWLTWWLLSTSISCALLFISAWRHVGIPNLELVVFLTVLPLVNLPFDFVSLAFTRALVRWSLDAKAPPPIVIGILDAVCALVVLIPSLAVANIAGMEGANWLTRLSGGADILPVRQLLDQIKLAPFAPSNDWLYITVLFPTILPSMFNFVILGTASLVGTWFPNGWILSEIRAIRADPTQNRGRIRIVSATLAAQWVLGFAVVAAASAGLYWISSHNGGWLLATYRDYVLFFCSHTMQMFAP